MGETSIEVMIDGEWEGWRWADGGKGGGVVLSIPGVGDVSDGMKYVVVGREGGKRVVRRFVDQFTKGSEMDEH